MNNELGFKKRTPTGMQRFLENATNAELIDTGVILNGHKMSGNTNLQRLGKGIASMLAQPDIDSREKEYNDAQQYAFESGNLDGAAANAAQNGDMDTAVKLAQAAENAKYRGAMIGMRQDAVNADAKMARDAKDAAQIEKDNMFSSAISALRELDELGKEDNINSTNKSIENWFLSDKSSKNIGRRTAALSALLPITNAQAKASGGSGINTVGEMMAYLGIPENATSAQIRGALPGLMKRLGVSESDLNLISGSSARTTGFTIREID